MRFFSQYAEQTAKSVFLACALAALAGPALAADRPHYAPAGAWQVGPAGLQDADDDGAAPAGMPCVVVNRFGNGMTLRFSGGGGQLMAMAIDFQRKVFTPQRKYEIELSVPGQYFQSFVGAAYDPQILVFGLYKFPDFYKAIQHADTLVVTVADAEIGLALDGLDEGFRRMEKCYGPSNENNQNQTVQKQSSPVARGHQNPLITRGDGLTPMPSDTALPSPSVASGPDPALSVDAVLNEPQPGRQAVKEDPATVLMARAQASEEAARKLSAAGEKGQAMATGWTNPQVVRPNAADIMARPQARTIAASPSAPMRWRAVRGGNVQDTLGSWAASAGVTLIWLPTDSFAVQRSVSFEDGFEGAVGTLLDQFSGLSPRPVGRMYREPGTTKPVLVIEQAGTGR